MAATREDIKVRCDAEGLGTMGDVFDILLDRGDVKEDDIIGFLDRHTDDNEGGVQYAYEQFIAPAIDELEFDIDAEA